MINVKQVVSTEPYVDLTQIGKSEDTFDEIVDKVEILSKKTYLSLRNVMLLIAILLPIVFLVSRKWVGMQPSISAFYHTDMQNVFVGALFAIGICLYVYKGYSPLEDFSLTVAGLFLFGVALFPTSDPKNIITVPEYSKTIHESCAIIFFGFIALVCIKCRKTAFGITSKDFHTAYNITAILMGLLLAAAGVLVLIKIFWGVKFTNSTFWLETGAIWIFARYWWLKGRELNNKTLNKKEE